LLKAIADEERVVVYTVVEGDGVGRKLLVTEAGERLGEGPDEAADQTDELIRRGRNRMLELADGTRVFAEVYAPPPRLLVIGAVDTAESLCRAARLLGWHTIVADARAKFATRERIPSADDLIVAWPQEAIAQVAPDHATAVVVLTHDDKFDVPALKETLATEAFYVGALGSRRNQEKRRERLLEAGVDEAELERISGPCGLDVGADTQPETAVSILAEILATRARRPGGRLQQAKTRIHVEQDEEAPAGAVVDAPGSRQ
jgi:xanthine dehydrogenase accessory factor